MKEFVSILISSFVDPLKYNPNYLRIHRISKDFKERIPLSPLLGRSKEDNLKVYQQVLKEPLKFLKDPSFNFLAIKSIKDPSIELFIEYVEILKVKTYHRISKDSIEEMTEEPFKVLYEEYK